LFTGLVEFVGRLAAVQERAQYRAFTIEAPELAGTLAAGDSVAVDGICLTVTEQTATSFQVQAVGATLERTTAGEWVKDRRLNLERALRADARLGGHFVQGHIDGVGTVLRLEKTADHAMLDLELPQAVAEVTVPHGSIAVDGVSLTVSALPTAGSARVMLIPHTWSHTNLPRLQAGDRVNLEGDLLGRFVVQYLQRRETAAQ
jgi:riboflavin synthase